MDVITKGGVIWEYLKGEVANGKEDITKADLLKVGYSAQAIENALMDIKKEKLAAKVVMPVSSAMAEPAPIKTVPTLVAHPADQDLMNDLSAAIKQDTKIEFDLAPNTPLPVAAPRGTIPSVPSPHQNFAQNLAPTFDAIPAMPLDLVHGSVASNTTMPAIPRNPVVASSAPLSPRPSANVVPPVPVPTPTVPPPMPIPAAQGTAFMKPPQIVTTVMPKKKHGLLGKFAMTILVLIVLAGMAAGVSYGMTGSWLPPMLSSLFEKYPKDKLFGVMLGNLGTIKTLSYTTSLDLKVQPYDSSVPRPPKLQSSGSTAQSSFSSTMMPDGYSIPADFNLHADLSGSADISDPTSVMNKNAEIKGTVTGTMGGVTFASNADLMKIDSAVYLQLNKLPSLGLFDLSKIEGKWVRFDQAAMDEFGVTDMVAQAEKTKLNVASSSSAQMDQALALEQIQALAHMAESANLITGTYMNTEKVGSVNTLQYTVTLNPDAFVALVTQAKATLGTKYGANSLLDSVDLSTLQTPDLKAAIAYVVGANQLHVLIDPQTALPVKAELVSRIASPEGVTAGKDQVIVSDSSIVLSHINEPLALSAPTDSMSAVEAYAALSGMTLDEYYEQKQVSNVSSIFYALGNFKAAAGVYPMSLNELTETPVQVRAAYPQTTPKKPAVKPGFDFAPWGDTLPILSKIPKDAFSKSDYNYTAAANKKDFQMKYEIRLASSTPNSIYLPAQFVNGINTMTSKAISIEGAAAAKKKKK